MIKAILKKNKCKKAKWLSEKGLQIAEKRREAKGKEEKERYIHLNAEVQRMVKRDKKAFLIGQCKEIEKNNRIGKTIFSRLSFGSFTLRTGTGRPEFLHSFFKEAEPNLGVKRVQQCHTVSKQQTRPRTKLSLKHLAHRTFESISLSNLETRVPSRLATPRVCSGHGLTSGHLS